MAIDGTEVEKKMVMKKVKKKNVKDVLVEVMVVEVVVVVEEGEMKINVEMKKKKKKKMMMMMTMMMMNEDKKIQLDEHQESDLETGQEGCGPTKGNGQGEWRIRGGRSCQSRR